jgi:hypothetical protein
MEEDEQKNGRKKHRFLALKNGNYGGLWSKMAQRLVQRRGRLQQHDGVSGQWPVYCYCCYFHYQY